MSSSSVYLCLGIVIISYHPMMVRLTTRIMRYTMPTQEAEMSDVTQREGYMSAYRQTMDRILQHARATSRWAVEPYIEIVAEDITRDRALAYAALNMPAWEWEVAFGRIRPENRFNILGRILFGMAVRQAKAEIRRGYRFYLNKERVLWRNRRG